MPQRPVRARLAYVDDDDLLRSAVESFLGRTFDVVTFSDPRHAVDYLSGHQVDAVVSDHDMPGMTGVQLYYHLSPHHQSRFILYTGNHDVESPSGRIIRKPTGARTLQHAVLDMLNEVS